MLSSQFSFSEQFLQGFIGELLAHVFDQSRILLARVWIRELLELA
jgi:hypothetical protein